jgi:two-component system, chemotaxis family, protein-glutamate methylesterase/glutaminase
VISKAEPKQERARAVVVIGASAGGVEALRELVAALPADLPAAVLVVLHVSAGAPSVLPSILARRAALPVTHARGDETVLAGHVYVAPPDQHLLLADGCTSVLRGPRENGVRPAVDPLFRSAAQAYGHRAIGVILSGTLDDGTLGLGVIKRAGGVAVVQDPADAMFDGMPRSACERVAVDHVVPLAEMGPLLARLARQVTSTQDITEGSTVADRRHVDEIERGEERREIDGGARQNEGLGGEVSGFTCPECHGALWEMRDGAVVRYRCRVGHAYAEAALQDAKGVSIEAALWTALTALDEQAALTWRMAQRARVAGNDTRRRRYEDKARALEERARVLDRVLRNTPLAAGGMTLAEGVGPHTDTGAP